MPRKKNTGAEQKAPAMPPSEKEDPVIPVEEYSPGSDAPTRVGIGFPIVGIGASAGGLVAFEKFFSGMPQDTERGMAFVLVQHLSPDHKSILTDLIKRYTPMQVFEVEDGMEVKPYCTYIIPPNRDMAILNGRLQLLEPTAPRGSDTVFKTGSTSQRGSAPPVSLTTVVVEKTTDVAVTTSPPVVTTTISKPVPTATKTPLPPVITIVASVIALLVIASIKRK